MTGAMLVYQVLGWLGLALGWPLLAARALRDPRYRVGWSERLGGWGTVTGGGVWVHGASVGEIRAAAPLTAALRERGIPLVLTTTNPVARDTARGLAGPGGSVRLLPLDLTPLVRRALRVARPSALVVVETELWPALIWESQKGRVPVLLINARISPGAFSRYLKFRRWLGPLLQTFQTIQAQSETDAERFLALGAPPERVFVVGNLKFDLPSPNASAPPARALRRARAGGWRVITAGSTHPGEEAAVLDAVDRLATQGARVGLVLAPRHLERLVEVESLIRANNRRVRRWGELAEPLEAGILKAFDADEVILIDRYGILDCLYGGGECAFVGGSLAPVGGHNLLEPLNWGVPVVFGPHIENMRQIRNEVVRRGLGTEVKGPSGLAEALWRYLNEPALVDQVRDGSRALFEAHRGAVDQALKALGAIGVLEDSGQS